MKTLQLRWVLVFLALAGACGGSTSKVELHVGEPCDVLVDAGPLQTAYVSNAMDCPSHMCLKPAVRSADKSLDTIATCSAPCSSDRDCANSSVRDSSNRNDKRCMSGFTCAVPFEVGPQCCQKMCVCKDFLPTGSVATPLACTSNQAADLVCKPSGPIATQSPELKSVVQTDLLMDLANQPPIDLIFVVDNSPGMAAKQKALADAFPALLAQLNGLPGGPPDLHIGIVSSDLGAGGSAVSGDCRVQGDQGRLQMKSGCGVRDGATWIEQSATESNFDGSLATVFACASQLGTGGCSYEHQLKSAAVALQHPNNQDFLRPNALLGIVFLTDEDDCSAPWNSDMFQSTLPKETTNLRCATRGHICNGKALEYPTTEAFEAKLADCQPNDSDTQALMPVKAIVDAIRASKDRPSEQILVAGIFGWPVDGGGNSKYRIGIDPSSSPGSEGKWDYLPTCQTAQGGKSYAGLRMRAFVEAFESNGLVSSLCTDDLSPALKQIGAKLRSKLISGCIEIPLIDTATGDGVQPDCRVVEHRPSGTTYKDTSIPACDGTDRFPCWRMLADEHCGGVSPGLRMDIARGPDAAGVTVAAPAGTLYGIKCRTCPSPNMCEPSYLTD